MPEQLAKLTGLRQEPPDPMGARGGASQPAQSLVDAVEQLGYHPRELKNPSGEHELKNPRPIRMIQTANCFTLSLRPFLLGCFAGIINLIIAQIHFKIVF